MIIKTFQNKKYKSISEESIGKCNGCVFNVNYNCDPFIRKNNNGKICSDIIWKKYNIKDILQRL